MEDFILHSTPLDKIREIVREEMRKGFEEHFNSAPNNKQLTSKYWTRKKAAEVLNITLPTLRKWTKAGKLKGHKIEGRVFYKPEEIDSSLVEQPKSVRK
jgi:excisionase family DNA binding protein